jgi:hypothetical protein
MMMRERVVCATADARERYIRRWAGQRMTSIVDDDVRAEGDGSY